MKTIRTFLASCFPFITTHEILEEEITDYIHHYNTATTKKYQAFYEILLAVDRVGVFPDSLPASEMMVKLKNYRPVILQERGVDIAKYHKYFGDTPKSIKMEMIIYTGSFADMKMGCTDENGQSFIHHAVKCRSLNILKCLLATGGENINLQDKFGKSPLFYTCSKKHDDGETVKILLHFGADANIKDGSGRTWVDYATARWNHKNLQVLNKLKNNDQT